MPPEEYQRLLPRLEPVELPMGWIVHGAGQRENRLYFPTAGTVSRFSVTREGQSAEFAITGCEGVIGVSSFLGGDGMPTQAQVVSPGHAYRLPADGLALERARGGHLPDLLLRYTLALMAQAGQSAVCSRHHSVEQRLCRWLAANLDRLESNEMEMTQELLGELLGVRRQSVAAAAAGLRREGMIRYARGRIAVVDRARVEARACECYAATKRELGRLLPGTECAHRATAPAMACA